MARLVAPFEALIDVLSAVVNCSKRRRRMWSQPGRISRSLPSTKGDELGEALNVRLLTAAGIASERDSRLRRKRKRTKI